MQQTIKEVEYTCAAGKRLDASYKEKLAEAADALRADNDVAAVERTTLREARREAFAELSRAVDEVLQAPAADASKAQAAQQKIDSICRQSKSWSSKLFQNCKGVGELKRTKALLSSTNEVSDLLERLEEALETGDVAALESVEAALGEKALELRSKYDADVKAVLEGLLDLKSSEGEVRSAYLRLRVRRENEALNRSAEADECRDILLKNILEVQRKSHKQNRLREHKVMIVKQIDVLERRREEVGRCIRVQKALRSGDMDTIQACLKEIWEDIDITRARAEKVVADEADVSSQIADVRSRLRGHQHSVTLESGNLREALIGGIRTEEWYLTRLATLSLHQARNVRDLSDLTAAVSS
eukprot:TRINITY_DN29670_c0_g1_i1.p1 TRINITY_DN29670_c0_g1~~TRINITY_DN29670_c0_g1_i1.p1  ORF type:complete len:358 (+),score=87.17 TRINITY_DN29670_c0_g1_i1:168-1241(+)